MEHDELDVNRWVDERLASLEPPASWRPDSSAAFAKLRRRARPRRWWVWAGLSAAAAAACGVVLLVSAPKACANPLGCSQGAPAARHAAPAAVAPPAPAALAPAIRTAPSVPAHYKQSGSPSAPVTCELYTDFECPHCAGFYLETMPQVVAAYVDTGKVRLIHRDFPLPRHRYARLAARYADAAGEAGYYQAAAARLFRTQAVWSANGDVDSQVARVVPPAAMEKVRARVQNDPAVEHSVAADEALARQNHIDHTPSLVCNRQTIGPLTYPEIQTSLDELLARQ